MNLDCLGDVRALYDRAECAMKQYERIAFEEQTEVLDCLREAAHAVWEVVQFGDDCGKGEEALRRARKECERAIRVSREGVVTYLMNEVNDFWRMNFSKAEIKTAMPDYEVVFAKGEDVRRRWRSDDSLNVITLDQMDSDFEELRRIRAKMDKVIPVLKELQYVRRKGERSRLQTMYDRIRDRTRHLRVCEVLIGTVMDWLAIVLTGFGIAMTVLQSQHWEIMVTVLLLVSAAICIVKHFCKKHSNGCHSLCKAIVRCSVSAYE